MKLVNLAKVSLGLMLAWGTVAQAEMAGRVLVAVGDTSAVRAGKEMKLVAGTPVETGDTLRVGDASNLQVRFTDEAIMALRPNTTMRIDDYAFTQKADSDKSIFSLLKGGLRTITGVIGRNSRANYAVKAETSTIGIRGTHFNLVHCANDCRNADGSQGQNGTFGGVTDGRIAVTNNAGVREFGKDEYFFVASRDALPAGLLAPPPFLRDRLEGQAKSKGKEKVAGAAGGETTQTANNTSTTTQPTISAPPLVVPTEPYVPGDSPIVAQSALVSWVVAWGWTDSYYGWNIGSEGTGAIAETVSAAEFNAVTSYLKQFEHSYTSQENIDRVAAGNVHWGVDTTGGGTGDHFAYGDPTPASMPSSGIFTFQRIGGTTPRNNEGAAGTFSSASPMVINFTNQTIVGNMSYSVPVPTAVGTGSVSYGVYINGTIYPGGTSSSYFTCGSAYGCTPLNMTSSGTGFGATLNGLAMGVATAATISSVTQTTATVQVYKRY